MKEEELWKKKNKELEAKQKQLQSRKVSKINRWTFKPQDKAPKQPSTKQSWTLQKRKETIKAKDGKASHSNELKLLPCNSIEWKD